MSQSPESPTPESPKPGAKPSPVELLKAASQGKPPAKASSTEKAPSAKKLSPIEAIKEGSQFLRGDIAKELLDGKPTFGKANGVLLKHHGTYQQDDRDRRKEAKENQAPGGKYFSFMVRTAISGGRITSEQLLAEIDLCDELGDGTLRITTRQGLQLHGVLKENLKATIRRINDVQLTTFAACGDVRRNLMCSPAPYKGDPVYDQMQTLAEELAKELRPQTSAYHELWLTDQETGEKTRVDRHERPEHSDSEPLYGMTYLPRKFKLGVALPGDNSADVYAQDVGYLAICENSKVVGYNVLVGGGMGVTPSAAKTFVGIAQPLAYVPTSDAVDVAKAILKIHRDFGNRADRKVARIRYVVRNWGIESFKKKVEEYLGRDLAPPRPVEVTDYNDALGWGEQGDGRWFYGLSIENGRVKDTESVKLKRALREICEALSPPMRLTPHQNILFCDLAPNDRERLEGILVQHGVPLTEEISTARRWSMACPALPMCGLAVTESERLLPSIIDAMEKELTSLGLENEVFTTRMTGCPNGCARPYNADIGLVGKAKGKYTLFLGGRRQGDRLNWIYKDMVPEADVVPTLVPVFRQFRDERHEGESLGDFCERKKDQLALSGDSA